jgi:hypothetical protein
MKEKIIDFILFLVSKELSYNEIKEEDELNSIKKSDYSTEFIGFKKGKCTNFLLKKSISLNTNNKKNNIKFKNSEITKRIFRNKRISNYSLQ